MSQHNKYKDGKVLRAADQRLYAPDLTVLLNNLKAGQNTIADLRVLDAVDSKIKDALGAYGEEYAEAIAECESEVQEKEITNPVAIDFLQDQAVGAVMRRYATVEASDVFLTVSDWSWMRKRWHERTNFGGDDANRARVLRITDVLDDALGYNIMPDKSIAIEGEGEGDGGSTRGSDSPSLHVVGE